MLTGERDNGRVRALLFDYGGTLDNGGRHWFRTIRLTVADIGIDIDDDTFAEAYIYAERQMATVGLVKPWHTFLDVMSLKMQLEMRWLAVAGHVSRTAARLLALEAARRCTDHARRCCADAARVLAELHPVYPMAVVSNFYGNLDTVMRDMGLRRYFSGIIESATVGIRKPDPRMWAMGAMALGSDPAATLAVGDSFEKDVCAALDAGMHAVWHKGDAMPWTDSHTATSSTPSGRFALIESLDRLPGLLAAGLV